MQPYQWTILGLSCDVMGALLLGVEAIKLNNFRRLRQAVLQPFAVWLEPTPLDRETLRPLHKGNPIWRGGVAWVVSHSIMGLIPFLLVQWLIFDLLTLTREFPWWAWLISLLLFPSLVTALMGEAVHQLLLSLARAGVRAAALIEARTPDGTVGLVGLLILLGGFTLQAYGAWSGRYRPSP